jgi:hypothetical protein
MNMPKIHTSRKNVIIPNSLHVVDGRALGVSDGEVRHLIKVRIPQRNGNCPRLAVRVGSKTVMEIVASTGSESVTAEDAASSPTAWEEAGK